MSNLHHTPVMVKEVLAAASPHQGDRLLDATLGLGGHARAFLEATAATGQVVGVDADAEALARAQENLKEFGTRVTYIHDHFSKLKDSIIGGGIVADFSHVLFDLGIGSHQLADARRGFSFEHNAPLTMKYGRLNENLPSQLVALNDLQKRLGGLPDAADIVRHLTSAQLTTLIRHYSEERYARRIAQAITATVPTTSGDLADIIRRAVPGTYERGRLDPATRTFQALRLATNRELEAIAAALPQAIDLLQPGGKLIVISFHSLEDRIVKHFFRSLSATCQCPPQQPVCTCTRQPQLQLLTRKPGRPSAEEIAQNPRARSAKLRAVIKNF